MSSTFEAPPTWHRRRRALLAIPLALVLVAGAACGDDDDAPAQPPSGEIEVVGVDYAFEGLPDEVAVGTTLTLRNDSPVEVHELVALRLADDETRSVEELLALPPEEAEQVLMSQGPPAMVLIAPPGSGSFAVVGDGTLTEPGRYAVLCFIPTGADPDEFLEKAQTSDGPPDVEGGPPHAAVGMWAEVTVS